MAPNRRGGFTIVELLMVIVVIAILAAITIVAYNGIQQRAITARFQSAILDKRQQAETAYITDGKYPFEDAVRAALAAGNTIGADLAIYQYFMTGLGIPNGYTAGGNFSDATIDPSGRLQWAQGFLVQKSGFPTSWSSDWFIVGSASAGVRQSKNVSDIPSMR